MLLLACCLLLLPLFVSVIVLFFVVRYFISILVCLVCFPGVSLLVCGSSSCSHGFVGS